MEKKLKLDIRLRTVFGMAAGALIGVGLGVGYDALRTDMANKGINAKITNTTVCDYNKDDDMFRRDPKIVIHHSVAGPSLQAACWHVENTPVQPLVDPHDMIIAFDLGLFGLWIGGVAAARTGATS